MMYRLSIITWIFILFVFDLSFAIKDDEYIQYLHPKPNSEYVSCQTNLIIRFQDKWRQYLNVNTITMHVKGDISGVHEGRVIRTNDKKTFIFKPFEQFLPDEIVHVDIFTNLPGFYESISYDFITSNRKESTSLMLGEMLNEYYEDPYQPHMDTYGEVSVINGVAIPSDFPRIDVEIYHESAPGRLFLNNMDGTPYIIILENDGTPYFYKRIGGRSWDFKLQPTGTITHRIDGNLNCFVELDSTYSVMDTLICGPGYHVNQHDIQLLSNGDYMILAWDEQIIDMSQLVEGGDTSATVIGNHIQQLDRDGNVIFEWRSWDHFEILDAVHSNLTANYIDYVHMNALAIDYDGHILISSRSLSEITKIDKETGEIIWRFGGENNQFTFVNDIYGISYQHDIRPVPNKPNYYTLFDNGNYHSPRFSRAVEFYLDTLTMTATKVWEYRPSPDRYAWKMGSVQRLTNGNTLINWALGPMPKATEVTAEGEVVYEMNYSEQSESYRSFRFDWDGKLKVPYLIAEAHNEKIVLIFNKFGDKNVKNYIVYADQFPYPTTAIDTTVNTWIELSDLENHQKYYFRVTAVDSNGEKSGFSNQEEVFVKYLDPGENLILNGDFFEDDNFWNLEVSNKALAFGYTNEGYYNLNVSIGGTDYDHVQLIQTDIQLIQGKPYLLEFDGWADNNRFMEVKLEKSNSPYDNYSKIGYIYLTSGLNHFSFKFEMEHISDLNAHLVFNCGNSIGDVFIDNVSLKEVITSGIQTDGDQIPENYHLYNNFPNPFNPKTIINYELPITNHVELNIYNLLGQKVVTLVSEKQKAGHYQVDWDASGYASGVYYYQLSTSEGFIQTKKLILLR